MSSPENSGIEGERRQDDQASLAQILEEIRGQRNDFNVESKKKLESYHFSE